MLCLLPRLLRGGAGRRRLCGSLNHRGLGGLGGRELDVAAAPLAHGIGSLVGGQFLLNERLRISRGLGSTVGSLVRGLDLTISTAGLGGYAIDGIIYNTMMVGAAVRVEIAEVPNRSTEGLSCRHRAQYGRENNGKGGELEHRE